MYNLLKIPTNICIHECLQYSFAGFLKESKGRLIFVTSIKARLVFTECGPYICTKWALEAYVDTLRRELKHFKVSVHDIQPGGFQTKLIGAVPDNFKAAWRNLPQETKGEYGDIFFKV